ILTDSGYGVPRRSIIAQIHAPRLIAASASHIKARERRGETMAEALIPERAAIAVADMLDNCARIQRDQHVLILSAIDGLHGGRNLVDEQAVNWIQAG